MLNSRNLIAPSRSPSIVKTGLFYLNPVGMIIYNTLSAAFNIISKFPFFQLIGILGLFLALNYIYYAVKFLLSSSSGKFNSNNARLCTNDTLKKTLGSYLKCSDDKILSQITAVITNSPVYTGFKQKPKGWERVKTAFFTTNQTYIPCYNFIYKQESILVIQLNKLPIQKGRLRIFRTQKSKERDSPSSFLNAKKNTNLCNPVSELSNTYYLIGTYEEVKNKLIELLLYPDKNQALIINLDCLKKLKATQKMMQNLKKPLKSVGWPFSWVYRMLPFMSNFVRALHEREAATNCVTDFLNHLIKDLSGEKLSQINNASSAPSPPTNGFLPSLDRCNSIKMF